MSEADLSVTDATDGLVSSVEYVSADETVLLRYVDQTYIDEWGEGAKIELPLPRYWGLIRGSTGPDRSITPQDMAEGLQVSARMLLESLGQPQRIISVTLPVRFAGMRTGDIVSLTHAGIPDWHGVRGLSSAVCQVQTVRRTFFGGRARIVAELRLSVTEGVCGYSPSVLVAAGGLNAALPTVTVDNATWGTSGFAPLTDATGTAVTDGGVSWFQTGDTVRLCELDNDAPIAEETFTVVSIDPTVPSITLDANPSAAMAALCAASTLKVILRAREWDNVVTAQQRYAFLADATPTLGAGSDDPKRYA